MKIARPSKQEVPFKRKRRPPPQATKLLRSSLAAAIIFIVLLAIVFLPRMFPSQPPLATPVQLVLSTANGTRLVVSSVGAMVNLTKFHAVFSNNTTAINLGPPLFTLRNGSFSFTDADRDGLLGPGDYFTLTLSSTGCSRVEVFQSGAESTFLVGRYASGGGCPSP